MFKRSSAFRVSSCVESPYFQLSKFTSEQLLSFCYISHLLYQGSFLFSLSDLQCRYKEEEEKKQHYDILYPSVFRHSLTA